VPRIRCGSARGVGGYVTPVVHGGLHTEGGTKNAVYVAPNSQPPSLVTMPSPANPARLRCRGSRDAEPWRACRSRRSTGSDAWIALREVQRAGSKSVVPGTGDRRFESRSLPTHPSGLRAMWELTIANELEASPRVARELGRVIATSSRRSLERLRRAWRARADEEPDRLVF